MGDKNGKLIGKGTTQSTQALSEDLRFLMPLTDWLLRVMDFDLAG